ncbi:MAG: hypothetical protein LCH26_06185 [Proteobacteria bacterium]|nr:hypothetical protein [Pseudomonadota bacterium]
MAASFVKKSFLVSLGALSIVAAVGSGQAQARWHREEVVIAPFPYVGRDVIIEKHPHYYRHHHPRWGRVHELDREINNLSRELDRHPNAWRARERRDALIAERERVLDRIRD